MQLRHTTITVDGRCIDLLLTDDEITTSFERTLKEENIKLINAEECCSCWPANPPPECPFWRKILGICRECEV